MCVHGRDWRRGRSNEVICEGVGGKLFGGRSNRRDAGVERRRRGRGGGLKTEARGGGGKGRVLAEEEEDMATATLQLNTVQ